MYLLIIAVVVCGMMSVYSGRILANEPGGDHSFSYYAMRSLATAFFSFNVIIAFVDSRIITKQDLLFAVLISLIGSNIGESFIYVMSRIFVKRNSR